MMRAGDRKQGINKCWPYYQHRDTVALYVAACSYMNRFLFSKTSCSLHKAANYCLYSYLYGIIWLP